MPSSTDWDPRRASLAEQAARDPKWRAELLRSLTDEQARQLRYLWRFWARPAQLYPPGSWSVWAIIAGRGFGKTRTGAETVRMWAERGGELIALVGRTSADVRDTMIEGPAGILACSHPDFAPKYEPSKRRLTWPNGTRATAYSAEEPALLRGPNHSKAWVDELAAWRSFEAFRDLQLGLRLEINDGPRTLITTTPRPLPFLKELLVRPDVVVTRGSTYENRANLAQAYIDEIVRHYEGTRMGLQELEGVILEDVEGALWSPAMLERQRWKGPLPDCRRVVIGVDPAITQGAQRDETGIVVVGLMYDRRAIVIEDLSTGAGPAEWAEVVLSAVEQFNADAVVVETNRGGDMCIANIRQACRGGWVDADGRKVPQRREPRLLRVRASKGKETRAEPFVAMYERGRIWHSQHFAELEDQMTTWIPGETRKSPDRMDALIWALAELFPAQSAVKATADRPEGW